MIWLSIWISNTYYLHKQFYLFKVLLPFQEIPILFFRLFLFTLTLICLTYISLLDKFENIQTSMFLIKIIVDLLFNCINSYILIFYFSRRDLFTTLEATRILVTKQFIYTIYYIINLCIKLPKVNEIKIRYN